MYEQIKDQLELMKFKTKEQQDGKYREESYLRRLYRILLLPVGDLQEIKNSEKFVKEKAN